MREGQAIVLIAHNIRSAHNIGALLRTAEGLGVDEVILSGYTPYPDAAGDSRLPHIARRAGDQIRKTALGAEDLVTWRHSDDIGSVLTELRQKGFQIAALEQSEESVRLSDFKPSSKVALLLGNEIGGLDKNLLAVSDVILEIPMRGRKESFNVTAAAAMALYHLSTVDK